MNKTLTVLTTALATATLLLPALAFAQTAAPSTNTPAATPTVKSAMNTVRTGVPSAASSMEMGKSSMSSQTTALIHINRATAKQLETLPGVSVKLAAEIIKDRPFKNSMDLEKKVKGIGAKNVKKMLPYISFT